VEKVDPLWFICCCGSLLMLLTAAGLGASIYQIMRGRSAGKRLAEQMGFTPLNEVKSVARQWYGGTYNRRQVAIRPVPYLSSSYDGFRSRRGYSTTQYMGIVLEAKPPKPLGYVVHGDRARENSLSSFEAGFEVLDGTQNLPHNVRDAMFEFSKTHYGKGSQGITLYASDRATLPDDLRSYLILSEIMTDVQAILMTNQRNLNMSPDEFRTILDDMIKVAEVMESARG